MTDYIFFNERLPFSTRIVLFKGRAIEVYQIPDDKKAELLKKIYRIFLKVV